MKYLIRIIFFCIIAAIATGYFFKSRADHLTGDRLIGLAVLAMAFILMPLFLVYRFRKASIRKYRLFNREQESEEASVDKK